MDFVVFKVSFIHLPTLFLIVVVRTFNRCVISQRELHPTLFIQRVPAPIPITLYLIRPPFVFIRSQSPPEAAPGSRPFCFRFFLNGCNFGVCVTITPSEIVVLVGGKQVGTLQCSYHVEEWSAISRSTYLVLSNDRILALIGPGIARKFGLPHDGWAHVVG